jgi:ABC-type uncharacterized transport system substrate-binding protein
MAKVGIMHSGSQESGQKECDVLIERLKQKYAKSLMIDGPHYPDDKYSLENIAANLMSKNVDILIATGGSRSAHAAMQNRGRAKKPIIVFTSVAPYIVDEIQDSTTVTGVYAHTSDYDGTRLEKLLQHAFPGQTPRSFNRPGGNATGTAGLTSELDPKRLEFLHETKPTAAVIGVLVNPNRPGLEVQSRELQATADKMNLKLKVQKAATDRELESAFQAFASQRVDALLVTADPFFNNLRARVLSLVASQSLPAIYQWRELVTNGGLMSYGPSITEAYRTAGINAGLILKGTKPSDIPVVQPTKFQFVVNLKTAKTLGLPIPGRLLAFADEVIE